MSNLSAFHAYAHRGHGDVARMRELLISARATHGHSCWHVGDLVWRLFLQSLGPGVEDTFRLWDGPDGTLLGFAVLTPSRKTEGVASFDL